MRSPRGAVAVLVAWLGCLVGCVLEPDIVASAPATGSSDTAMPSSGSGDATGTVDTDGGQCLDTECTCNSSPCALECPAFGCAFDCSGPLECAFDCPAGGCGTSCSDGASCDVVCDGPVSACPTTCDGAQQCAQTCTSGFCTMMCTDTEVCEMACPGGTCELDCVGAQTCRITECTGLCTLSCGGAEVCESSCGVLQGCSTTP